MFNLSKILFNLHIYTAIPYRASTGPEQGFPCVLFPQREKPVFITGFPGDKNMFFPLRKITLGKPCFHYIKIKKKSVLFLIKTKLGFWF
jgi:hypothetical protein